MEKINLVEILKNVPKGTKLYSLIHGDCFFERIVDDSDGFPIEVKLDDDTNAQFTEKGCWLTIYSGECVLFPSKENRNWLNFKVDDNEFRVGDYVRSRNSGCCFKINNINETLGIYCIGELVSDCKIQGNTSYSRDILINGFEKIEKFDRSCFRPFDRVLVRDYDSDCWKLGNLSHIDDSSEFKFVTTACEGFKHCVPYNSDTENLLGTADYAPEFYEEECYY